MDSWVVAVTEKIAGRPSQGEITSGSPIHYSAGLGENRNLAVTEPLSRREKVLVVDDEPDILALCEFHLAKAGYAVSRAATGAAALEHARRDRPALVVLDLMLPDIGGFDVLRLLRADESTRDTPVLLLTARKDETDRIRGLTLGADDYLTKPFSPQELVLRVAAILRRSARADQPAQSVLEVGPLRVDKAAHVVTVDGAEVDLTALEFKLLLTLVERRGRVQTRAALLDDVWEAAPDVQTRTVDMHVQRLRAKLGDAGAMIETVRSIGYRFRADKKAGK
jgi:two-component system phosphate regulon response regulator PhoB